MHGEALEVTLPEVYDVLKRDMGMSWKKINKVASHCNSVRNLIIRQQCCVRYLELSQQGKIWLSMDETWLNL